MKPIPPLLGTAVFKVGVLPRASESSKVFAWAVKHQLRVLIVFTFRVKYIRILLIRSCRKRGAQI